MAIATNGGHVQRAIDFYNKAGKYFVIGGTNAWTDESSPDSPAATDYKLLDTVGYKKVDHCHLVVPDANGSISYRTQNWRIVPLSINTTLGAGGVSSGAMTFNLVSLAGLTVGMKLRIADLYEGIITTINSGTNQIILDTAAPSDIPSGAKVQGGAIVEGAKYVYIDCFLNYDQFPLVTYRQIGVATEVTPNTSDKLLAATYAAGGSDEFTSKGVLEIIDNRSPSTRDIDMREQLSLILEM